MKTIEEYEKIAREILDKRYGIDPNPPFIYSFWIQPSYKKSEITETISQLVMRDFIEEFKETAQPLSFDSDGCVCVKVENHD